MDGDLIRINAEIWVPECRSHSEGMIIYCKKKSWRVLEIDPDGTQFDKSEWKSRTSLNFIGMTCRRMENDNSWPTSIRNPVLHQTWIGDSIQAKSGSWNTCVALVFFFLLMVLHEKCDISHFLFLFVENMTMKVVLMSMEKILTHLILMSMDKILTCLKI